MVAAAAASEAARISCPRISAVAVPPLLAAPLAEFHAGDVEAAAALTVVEKMLHSVAALAADSAATGTAFEGPAGPDAPAVATPAPACAPAILRGALPDYATSLGAAGAVAVAEALQH